MLNGAEQWLIAIEVIFNNRSLVFHSLSVTEPLLIPQVKSTVKSIVCLRFLNVHAAFGH